MFYSGLEGEFRKIGGNMHKKISIEQSKISDGINFVENGLAELKIAKKQRMKTMLVVEEALVKLTEHAESQDDQIGISLNKNLNRIYVNMTLRGQEFQLIQGYTVEEVLNRENDDQQSSQEEEGMIRDILLRSNKDQLRYKNKNHTNMVEIMVQKNHMQWQYRQCLPWQQPLWWECL